MNKQLRTRSRALLCWYFSPYTLHSNDTEKLPQFLQRVSTFPALTWSEYDVVTFVWKFIQIEPVSFLQGTMYYLPYMKTIYCLSQKVKCIAFMSQIPQPWVHNTFYMCIWHWAFTFFKDSTTKCNLGHANVLMNEKDSKNILDVMHINEEVTSIHRNAMLSEEVTSIYWSFLVRSSSRMAV